MSSSSLSDLPTTSSGSVRKRDAMDWMESLGEPDEDELLSTVVPKPNDHSGSSFATPISNIRVTGRPDFITAVTKLLKPLLAWESSVTRLAINLQQIEDRDTGELTDNYAIYLSTAMRGQQGALSQAFLGQNQEADQRLVKALENAGEIEG